MRYFEVFFDKNPADTICIRGIREPTAEEASEFCRKHGCIVGEVYLVEEIDASEARVKYEFSSENGWPVFGK